MNGGTSGGHFGASKAHWSAADVYKEMAFNGLKAAIQTTNAMVPDNGWLELEYFFPVPLLPFSFFFFVVFFYFLLFASIFPRVSFLNRFLVSRRAFVFFFIPGSLRSRTRATSLLISRKVPAIPTYESLYFDRTITDKDIDDTRDFTK